jgi:hypothetical protein
MSDALTGYDSWKTADPYRFEAAETDCHWCNESVAEDLGPCERSSCQEAAEDDHRLDRINAARAKSRECLIAALQCVLMAGRYIAEGDVRTSERVRGCEEQALSWRDQANDWRAKADALMGVQVLSIEGVRHAAE